MIPSKKWSTYAGWLVFTIAVIVYYFSAERSGSLWDCGEFILGAYKLQVVHPPGAPLFLMVGRVFTMFAQLFSDNPETIAFAVNLMSGVFTASTAMLVCWITIMFGNISMDGKNGDVSKYKDWVVIGAGIAAGLSTAFTSSIWFSAVEGEVYAMSTFFTALTLWAVVKWYSLPNDPKYDRWLIFAIYSSGLSIGVHLLSLLTFPALALFYYFKRYKNHNWKGMLVAAATGTALILVIQTVIISGVPKLWAMFELMTVNGLGLPFHSGLIPMFLLIAILLFFGLRYAHQKNSELLQSIFVVLGLLVISYSMFGMVVIRANANTPINMNAPDDAMRLLPYLNREQYGERALLRGTHFDGKPVNTKTKDRYGAVGDRYEVVDQKVEYEWNDADMMLFPRIGHTDQGRPQLHRMWMGLNPNEPLPPGRPNQMDNMSFMVRYQIGWMYWRYFMWNFSGRQNGEQGYYPWDLSSGHWISGIPFIDEMRLFNQSQLPDSFKNNEARNTYFMLPFLFGLFGMFYHFKKSRKEFLGLMAMFIITGLGIIIYSNQPPNEPRERDYVLAGSFFTYCIWIGLGVLGLFQLLISRAKLLPKIAAPVAIGLVLLAPIIMGFQNFDDHTRKNLSGARDYASNFLESCDPNSIIFTYGDNDTYPLWYAQEVEGIRTDVRVVNLSLIAVDWYINQLRRKVNNSPAIKMKIPEDAIRGKKRNQLFVTPQTRNNEISIQDFIKFVSEDHPYPLMGGRYTESWLPSTKVFIPVDSQKVMANGILTPEEATDMVARIPFDISKNLVSSSLIKGDIAVLDILASNIWERPIYFAVTCRDKSLLGLDDYLQLEGLGLKLVPVKTKSERIYGMVGKGSIDEDKVYENAMTKFKWGNFDKVKQFVEGSFSPSITAHRMIFLRAIGEFMKKGDKGRAVEMVDKYLEVFPHMNFPYDYNTYLFLDTYIKAGAFEKAKPHLRTLAIEIADRMEFYYSLDPEDLESGFENQFGLVNQTLNEVLRQVPKIKDDAFTNEIKSLLEPYKLNTRLKE